MLEEFLDVVAAGLGQRPPETEHTRPARPSAIRWGAIGLRDDAGASAEIASATIALSLVEEADAVQWIHGEIERGRSLPLAEAEAVVRSLAVAMHGDQQVLLPLLRLREFDEYTTTHSLNVSVLAMALAKWDGARRPRRALVRHRRLATRSREGACSAGTFSRNPGTHGAGARVDESPSGGRAEIILSSEPELELAAVVAYEHHVMLNGGGYPAFTYPRTCHLGSRLVHVCDVYDALRTDRPYRKAWPQTQILAYLDERSGTEFEPEMAEAFTRMMQQWEPADVRTWRAGG